MASDKLFKLRKVLQSNSMDVRAITSYPNGFVCGSRDKIAKVYLNEELVCDCTIPSQVNQ